ncbi:MAG TPA: ATP-grasp domain-containing protein, partial [Arenicellales bacterium]|nr:ATP-grasp domain-containing protein [Arenicellales bacterium]
GIMEHIEQAGVHSGDSACSLPPFSLSSGVLDALREQTERLARALNVVGLMNIQFAVKGDDVYILEVNPRASRTVPYVSKATSRPLAKIAARCMAGRGLAEQGVEGLIMPEYYSVKEAVFPYIKFPGVDTILGPEMRSTGEVMGVGRSFGEAFGKSQQAAGSPVPMSGCALISVKQADQAEAIEIARYLSDNGFKLVATRGTAEALLEAGVEVTPVNKVKEGRPHIVDMIKNQQIDVIVNTTSGKQSVKDSYMIRREALHHKITYFTTLAAARAACEAHRVGNDYSVASLQELHAEIRT